jgi:hypothetical protein
MEPVVRATGVTRIVDLCSGASGPVVPLREELSRYGIDIPALLTDKFPAGPNVIQADATNLPPGLTGFRTLFNSFHHFRPEQAHAILADAVRERQPIAIFEITDRSTARILKSFPASFVGVFLLLFFMRPRRPEWWLGTWLVPVIPFTVAWDGLVSHLRSYTAEEMNELTRDLKEGYRWQIGKVRAPKAGVQVSYTIGSPATPAR